METQHIARTQFLKLARLTVTQYKQLMNREDVSLAWGSPIPALAGHYTLLDAVAMRIAEELSKLLVRREAAAIVLSHWSVWLAAVGCAEHDHRHIYFFAVGIRGRGDDRQAMVAGGSMRELAEHFRTFEGARVAVISITDLLADMREIARAEGIDMSAPVFISPEHPKYAETLREGDDIRKKALARWRKRAADRELRVQ